MQYLKKIAISRFVQIVQSQSIAEITSKHESIKNYLKKQHPSTTDDQGIKKECMDNYIKVRKKKNS